MTDSNSENSYIELDFAKPKRCTDKRFLAIFGIVLAFWTILGAYAYALSAKAELEYIKNCPLNNLSFSQVEKNYSICSGLQTNPAMILRWLKIVENPTEIYPNVEKTNNETTNKLSSRNTSCNTNYEFYSNRSGKMATESSIFHFIRKLREDFDESIHFIIIFSGLSIIIGLILLSAFQWIAGVLVWVSIVHVFLLTLAGGVLCSIMINLHPPNIIPWNFMRINPQYQWITLAVAMFTMCIIYWILIYYFRTKIEVAIGIMKESSKVMKIPLFYVLFLLSSAVFYFMSWTYLMWTFLKLSEAFDPSKCCSKDGRGKGFSNGTIVRPDCWYDWTELRKGLYLGTLIPYIWFTVFIAHLYATILSASFAITFKGGNTCKCPFYGILKASRETLRYHLGTVAIGSLVGAISIIIKIAGLKFMLSFFRKMSCVVRHNYVIKNASNKKPLSLVQMCLHPDLDSMLKHSYVICAMNGTQYSKSLWRVRKIWRNEIISFFKVTHLMLIFIKVALPGILCSVIFSVVYYTETKQNYFGIVPAIIVFTVAFLSFYILFSVSLIAVETITICFLDDLDSNACEVNRNIKMPQILMNALSKEGDRRENNINVPNKHHTQFQ